ncbi:hypothetical protein SUGI_0293830 [Cryptomeria japonica]|nr:hypothetical protein SUGI_0293830 [Cryptomeria japonica]
MDVAGDVLGKPRLWKIAVKKENKGCTDGEEEINEFEPVTPAGRVFSQPALYCYIITIFKLKTQIDVETIKSGLESSLLKHKRFSSVMEKDKNGKLIWVPAEVNICDHVLVPCIDPEENESSDFYENYSARLASAPPLDSSRPQWQFHLLNVKSQDAASGIVMRVHHSLGDGVSLMSLLLACTRQHADPNLLPTIPRQTRSSRIAGAKFRGLPLPLGILLGMLLVVWYTVVDILYFAATIIWLKDSLTPIKGYPGVESGPKKIVHQSISLEDIKLVKDAIKGTVNDVMLGITSAGITRYLERRYKEERSENADADTKKKAEQRKKNGESVLPSKLRVRSTILVNTRPAPGLHELAEMMESGNKARWGNNLGYVILSLPTEKRKNPLDYARAAAAIFRRKKLSLEAPFTYASGTLLLHLAGVKAATILTYNMIANTTFSFSNMVGPLQEVEFFGHPIMDIIPTVSGHPHALTMHFQSYMGKVTLVVSAATDVIADPKQLCLDCIDAFHSMKQAAAV